MQSNPAARDKLGPQHTLLFTGTAKSQDPRPPCELLGGVNVCGWWGETAAMKTRQKDSTKFE